jgi:hypothetical protein
VAEAVSFPPTLQRLQRRTVRVLVVAQLLGAYGLAAGGTAGALLGARARLGGRRGGHHARHERPRTLLAGPRRRLPPDDTHLHKRLLQAVRDRSRTPYEAGANHTPEPTPAVEGPRDGRQHRTVERRIDAAPLGSPGALPHPGPPQRGRARSAGRPATVAPTRPPSGQADSRDTSLDQPAATADTVPRPAQEHPGGPVTAERR